MKKVLDTIEHLCIRLQLLVMVAGQGTLTIYAEARRPLRAILHNGTDGDLRLGVFFLLFLRGHL